MQSGWISKNKGFVSTSPLAAICILLSLLFFSSSQGIFYLNFGQKLRFDDDDDEVSNL